MIRPENKRRKAHQTMLESLEVGDEVITSGGVLGRVTKVHDQYIDISVSKNVNLKFQKNLHYACTNSFLEILFSKYFPRFENKSNSELVRK